jgi:hypothetical protein
LNGLCMSPKWKHFSSLEENCGNTLH